MIHVIYVLWIFRIREIERNVVVVHNSDLLREGWLVPPLPLIRDRYHNVK